MVAVVLALLTSLAPLAAPQDRDGRPIAGRVVGPGGAPVAGAAVHLLHRPLPIGVDETAEHRVRVATDAAGVFRAPVRAGARYSVWAHGPDAATSVVDGVEAGSFLTLEVDPQTRPVAVQVAGADAWGDLGPLRYRALVGSENVDFVAVDPVDGVLRVPALPWFPTRELRVLTAAGELLWATRIDGSRAGGARVEIPAPLRFDVVVRDDRGEPVPDAEVRVHLHNHWLTASPLFPGMQRFDALWPVVGRSGKDGRAAARAPLWSGGGAVPEFQLLVRAPGHRAVALSAGGPAATPGDGAQAVEVVLERASADPIPVAVAGSTPAEGRARVLWRLRVPRQGGHVGVPFVEELPVAAGRLACTLLPPADHELELAWFVPAVRAPAVGGVAAPSWALLDGDRAGLSAPEPGTTVVRVVTPGGRPAERALVVVTRADARGRVHEVQRLRTDRLGRGAVAVGDAGGTLAVLGDGAFAEREVDAERSGEEIWIDLRPMPRVPVRVVGPDGEAVPGARVSLDAIRLTASRIALTEDAWATTDAEGRALLPFVAAGAQLAISAVAEAGRLRGRQTFVTDGEEPGEVVVALRGM